VTFIIIKSKFYKASWILIQATADQQYSNKCLGTPTHDLVLEYFASFPT